MKLTPEIEKILKPHGITLLKLTTSEQIITDLFSTQGNATYDSFFFLKHPLMIISFGTAEGKEERALIPWIECGGVFAEDEFIIIRKDSVITFDTPLQQALENWEVVSKKYVESVTVTERAAKSGIITPDTSIKLAE